MILGAAIAIHVADVLGLKEKVSASEAHQFPGLGAVRELPHGHRQRDGSSRCTRSRRRTRPSIAQTELALQKYPDFRAVCTNCHAPIGNQITHSDTFPLPGEDGGDAILGDGVTCWTCHALPNAPTEIEGAEGRLPRQPGRGALVRVRLRAADQRRLPAPGAEPPGRRRVHDRPDRHLSALRCVSQREGRPRLAARRVLGQRRRRDGGDERGHRPQRDPGRERPAVRRPERRRHRRPDPGQPRTRHRRHEQAPRPGAADHVRRVGGLRPVRPVPTRRHLWPLPHARARPGPDGERRAGQPLAAGSAVALARVRRRGLRPRAGPLRGARRGGRRPDRSARRAGPAHLEPP